MKYTQFISKTLWICSVASMIIPFGYATGAEILQGTPKQSKFIESGYLRAGKLNDFKISDNVSGGVTWGFGDGKILTSGSEVIYKYARAGVYKLSAAYKSGDGAYKKISQDITVYSDLIVYGTTAVFPEGAEVVFKKNGTLIMNPEEASLIGDAPDLVILQSKFMFDKFSTLKNYNESDIYIFYDGYEYTISRVSQRFIASGRASGVTIVKSKAEDFAKALISGQSLREVTDNLHKLVESKEVTLNNLRPSLLGWMSYLCNKALQAGVPENTLMLLILIPAYLLLFILFKQIVGFSFANDIFNPLILALIWQAAGFRLGLLILVSSIVLGVILRQLFKSIYIGVQVKRGLFFGSLAFGLFLLMYPLYLIAPGVVSNVSSQNSSYLIFLFLLIIIVTERVLSLERNVGWRRTLVDYLEVGFIAILSLEILELMGLKLWMFAFPELIVLILILTVLAGKYTGLRLLEIWKFRQLIFGKSGEDDSE